jgi:hypothetical protein
MGAQSAIVDKIANIKMSYFDIPKMILAFLLGNLESCECILFDAKDRRMCLVK